MFGRNRRSELADAAAVYATQLIEDEAVRQRTLAAIAVALAARRRAMQNTGLTGLARRLATDDVLRRQLAETVDQLRSAQRRARREQSHRLRNTLVVAGLGAAVAVATMPGLRKSLLTCVRGGEEPTGAAPSTVWEPSTNAEPAPEPAAPSPS